MMSNDLQFAFHLLRPETDSLGRVICWATRSNTYHVETWLRDRWFSAHITEGVRFTDSLPNIDDPTEWQIIRTNGQCTDQIATWAESIVGSPYDELGALNSAYGIPIRDPYRWFCSLVAEEIASRAGMIGLTPLPSPAKFRTELQAHEGLASAGNLYALELTDKDKDYLVSVKKRSGESLSPELEKIVCAS